MYRHFPLSQVHSNADTAARASEAAGNQGKFWEMHDKLFETQKTWSNQGNAEDIFAGYAEGLGLDVERFRNDIDSKEVKDRVRDDSQSGVRAGINSTPTFFINGEQIVNPRNLDEFRNVILEALKTGGQ